MPTPQPRRRLSDAASWRKCQRFRPRSSGLPTARAPRLAGQATVQVEGQRTRRGQAGWDCIFMHPHGLIKLRVNLARIGRLPQNHHPEHHHSSGPFCESCSRHRDPRRCGHRRHRLSRRGGSGCTGPNGTQVLKRKHHHARTPAVSTGAHRDHRRASRRCWYAASVVGCECQVAPYTFA